MRHHSRQELVIGDIRRCQTDLFAGAFRTRKACRGIVPAAASSLPQKYSMTAGANPAAWMIPSTLRDVPQSGP